MSPSEGGESTRISKSDNRYFPQDIAATNSRSAERGQTILRREVAVYLALSIHRIDQVLMIASRIPVSIGSVVYNVYAE